MLDQIQRDLFALGAVLADPRHRIAARVEKAQLGRERRRRLERWIDALEPVRCRRCAGSFSPAARRPARCCIWRAPSAAAPSARIVALGADAVDPVVVVYMNRLSDLLFVMARAVNARAGVAEIEW